MNLTAVNVKKKLLTAVNVKKKLHKFYIKQRIPFSETTTEPIITFIVMQEMTKFIVHLQCVENELYKIFSSCSVYN